MSHSSRTACFAKVNCLILLIAAATVVAACAGSNPEGATVTMEVSESGLSPGNVTVLIGQPAELRVENRTGAIHEIAVADIPLAMSGGSGEHNMAGMSGNMADMAAMPPIHMVVGAGESQSLMFTPSKAGRYEFTCLTPGHSERGVLTVTDD